MQINFENIVEGAKRHSGVIMALYNTGDKVYTMATEASALKELNQFSNTLKTANSRKQIFDIFSGLPSECKGMLSKQSQENITNSGEWINRLNAQKKQKILCEIDQCQKNLVKSLLLKELFCSLGLLLSQRKSLQELAEELRQTEWLVEDSRQKIDAIIEELNKLKDDLNEAEQTWEELKQTETEQKKEVVGVDPSALFRTLFILSQRESKVRRSIEKLKVTVDGKVARLGELSTGAFRDACVGASQVAGNLLEYSMAGGMYSALLTGVKAFTTTAFALMSAAKYQQSLEAAKRIKELADILRKVETMEADVDEVNQVVLDALEWIQQKEMELRESGGAGKLPVTEEVI